MTTDGHPSNERIDEALRCLGLIAVGAAALEANLARLATLANDDLEYRTVLRLSNRKKVEAVRSGLQVRRNLYGTERRDTAGRKRAIAWAEDALGLLQQRGDLMHSEWIIARRISDRRAPKELLGHHLSSGRRTPVDPEPLQLLADQIDDHTQRYRRIWQFANRVEVWHSVAEWELLFAGRAEAQPPSTDA
jgi:hypothetical protein